jgi:GntR family transcriptional regulator
VAKGAKERIMKSRKEEFINHTLPEIFRQMRLLSIDLKDIEAFW